MAGESAEAVARRQRDKAASLQRSADQWQRGAEGERATAGVLDALPREYWTVLHDLAWPGRPRANIDHVAVGPPGVFVIDSKNWSGAVTLRDGQLRQSGRSRASSVAGVEAATQAVAELLLPTGAPVTRGVLCLTGSSQPSGTAGMIRICSLSDLSDYLLSVPPTVHEVSLPELVNQVISRLQATDSRSSAQPTSGAAIAGKATARGSGSSGRSRPSFSRSAPARGRRSTNGPRASDWFRASVGVVIVVVALTQPQVLWKAASGISGMVVSQLTFGDEFIPSGEPTDNPERTQKSKQERKDQKRDRSEAGR